MHRDPSLRGNPPQLWPGDPTRGLKHRQIESATHALLAQLAGTSDLPSTHVSFIWDSRLPWALSDIVSSFRKEDQDSQGSPPEMPRVCGPGRANSATLSIRRFNACTAVCTEDSSNTGNVDS
ncbi:hypothetical protein P7K49_002406 [Saguinus oedipus]|uniref:Uncharacterized protein n=1 Tax=Saguinus oedipus TaxID=9490 RepID=A0ABQ9WHU5_SAGOE|nr:hypothetical protein P7K49_002406 [Saguinus oedipus]